MTTFRRDYMAAPCSPQEETPVPLRRTGRPSPPWTGVTRESPSEPQGPVSTPYEPRFGIFPGHAGILFAIKPVTATEGIGGGSVAGAIAARGTAPWNIGVEAPEAGEGP